MHAGRGDRADCRGDCSQQMSAAGRHELTIGKCRLQSDVLGTRYQVIAQPRQLIEESSRDEDALRIK